MTSFALYLLALLAEYFSPWVRLKEGLKAYGLKDLRLDHPESCRPLFIKEHVEAVDANYLVGLLEPEFCDMRTPERTVENQVIDNFQEVE